MKPLALFFFTVFVVLCHSAIAQTTSKVNLERRANKGDTVWVIINHVKADKRQQFENFINETFWPSAKKLEKKDQMVFKQTRVLYPTTAQPDGSYTYIFLMDPFISGGDYDITSLLTKMYGKQKAADLDKVLSDTYASDQTQYLQVQSQY
jgi:hypothetical protein